MQENSLLSLLGGSEFWRLGEIFKKDSETPSLPISKQRKQKETGNVKVIGKPAALASHGNVQEDNFKNVANVEMLPMPMLPVPIEIEDWEWQHWILATFDQVIGKNMIYPKR